MKLITITTMSLVLSSFAHADTTLAYTTKLETGSLDNSVLIKNNTVKSWMSPSQYMLFDASTSRTLLVNTQAKTVSELKPQDLSQVKLSAEVQARLKESQELIKKTLANLPEEQKKLVEQGIKDKLIAQGVLKSGDKFELNKDLDAIFTTKINALAIKPNTPNITHVKTQQQKTINGYPCEITEGLVDNKKTVTLCFAPPKALGLSEKDSQTYQAFNLMMQKIGGVKEPKNNPQIAVSMVNHGQKDQEQLLSKVTFDELNATEFTIPTDYKETNITGVK